MSDGKANLERHEKIEDKLGHEIHERHEKGKVVILPEESFRIQGAIFEVYKELGAGFLEAVYQECLEHEFALQGIPFVSQVELPLAYKGIPLSQKYRADLVCFGSIIIELKTCSALLPVHRAQVLNYLKATGMRLGLLVNFGANPKVGIERIVL